MDVERIGIVACCKQKLEHYAPAKTLYQSLLFKLSRLYAEKVCDRWVILSALHGVVFPDQCLHPYDLDLRTAVAADRLKWVRQTHEALIYHFVPSVRFVVLAGRDYARAVPDDDKQLDIRSLFPLEGMGIGRRINYLSKMVGKKAMQSLEGIDHDIPF